MLFWKLERKAIYLLALSKASLLISMKALKLELAIGFEPTTG